MGINDMHGYLNNNTPGNKYKAYRIIVIIKIILNTDIIKINEYNKN